MTTATSYIYKILHAVIYILLHTRMLVGVAA